MVSEDKIKELQKIVKNEYGKELSFKQTSKLASDLVGYFNLLIKLNHQTQNNILQLTFKTKTVIITALAHIV